MKLRKSDQIDRSPNLAELFFLLAIKPSGSPRTTEHTIRLGVAGAVLTDLARRGRIVVTETTVEIDQTNETAMETPLEKAFTLIQDSPKIQDAEQWINRFTRPGLQEAVVEELETLGYLETKETSFLGLYKRTKYVKSRPHDEIDFVSTLRDTLLGYREPDLQTIPILNLLYITGLIERVMPELNRKNTRQFLADTPQLVDTPISRSVAEAIQATENAVAESLVASRGGASGLGR